MILFDYFGHMVATENEMELHIFARKLGLKRQWFQQPSKNSKRHSHYDLTTTKKKNQALLFGAKQVPTIDIITKAWWAKEAKND